jgi:hypothetical protein
LFHAKKTPKTFTPEVGEIRETRSCFNVMRESDKPEKKQLKIVFTTLLSFMIYDDNPITLILKYIKHPINGPNYVEIPY